MKKALALMVLLTIAAASTPTFAAGKKGRLTKVLEITRHDFHDVDADVPSVEIEGFNSTIVVDHEAQVLVHGILTVGNSSYPLAVTVVVDGLPDPDPLVFTTGILPILRSFSLPPGTHEVKVVVNGVDGQPVHFAYRDRRLVVLVF